MRFFNAYLKLRERGGGGHGNTERKREWDQHK